MAMKTRGVECCFGAHPSSRRGARRAGALGLLFAALAALIPKCPMCLAAWLGIIGLSRLALHLEPRTLGFATALLASLAVAALCAAVIHRIVGSTPTNTANNANTVNTAKGDRT